MVSSKEFLDIQTTIECGFTLKRVRDMTRTYNQSNFGTQTKQGKNFSQLVLTVFAVRNIETESHDPPNIQVTFTDIN